MLVLTLRRCASAIRMANANLESRRAGIGRELSENGARQYRVEHKGVSRDPADQPAPQAQSRSSLPNHSTPFGCARTSLRIAQDTVQRIIA